MRKVVSVAVAISGMFLIPGVATAESTTYQFSDEWQLAYIDGRPTVVPQMEDDVVEVKCLNDDQMTDWFVNSEELVAGSYERVDGTGIQVKPDFTGETETLKITVTCERN